MQKPLRTNQRFENHFIKHTSDRKLSYRDYVLRTKQSCCRFIVRHFSFFNRSLYFLTTYPVNRENNDSMEHVWSWLAITCAGRRTLQATVLVTVITMALFIARFVGANVINRSNGWRDIWVTQAFARGTFDFFLVFQGRRLAVTTMQLKTVASRFHGGRESFETGTVKARADKRASVINRAEARVYRRVARAFYAGSPAYPLRHPRIIFIKKHKKGRNH